MCPRDLKTLW